MTPAAVVCPHCRAAQPVDLTGKVRTACVRCGADLRELRRDDRRQFQEDPRRHHGL